MFKITKDNNEIKVSVKLPERKLSKDKKIVIDNQDALREAQLAYPDVDFLRLPKENAKADNRVGKLEATWLFEIVKKQKPKQDKVKKILTTKKKKDTVSKENESKKEDSLPTETE